MIRRFTDVMCCAGLMWAMGERGNDVYERFQGCRRPQTSRLTGGGFPLQVPLRPTMSTV